METRTALVTGASQGLGQEFAVALAGRGYRVAGLDLVPQRETAGRILDYVELVADVTDEAQIHGALEQVLERFGTLHVLINNAGDAGVRSPSAFEDITPEEWRRVMRVNLEAPFLMARAVLPYLKAAGWGRIVNIVSAAVRTAPPTMVARTASEAGLIGFTRSLASALGPCGITVNAIAPGLVRTKTTETAETAEAAKTAERTAGANGGSGQVRARQAVPGPQEPADLVSTLLYVVDEGSGFLTGQTLDVAGGPAGA